MTLINALKNNLSHSNVPFNHWIINSPLSEKAIDEIYSINFPEGKVIFDGTRAGDKTGDNLLSKLRIFINKGNAEKYPELTGLVKEMQSKECTEFISNLINRDLKNSYVRLEVIADRDGFWLEPHCDIKEKLMSSILFVNRYGENENLGTDFYTPDLEVAKTLPYNCLLYTSPSPRDRG